MRATSSPSDQPERSAADRSGRLGPADLGFVALACGLSLLATVPRLTDRPFWTDEGLTVGATSQLLDTLRGTGGTMALYYALITPIASITTDRFWLRLPSALFVAGAVAVTYLVARRIGDRWLAACSSLLLAASWALARWGIEARGYGLAVLLVSISWLGVVEIGSATDPRRRRRGWILFAVGALLGPLAHGLAALQLPTQVAVLLLRSDRRRHVRPLIALGVAWALLLLVLFAYGAGEVADWIQPITQADLKQIFRMLVGRGAPGLVVAVPILAGTAIAVRRAVRAAPWRGPADAPPSVGAVGGWLPLTAAAWAWGLPVTVLLISLVRPYQASRYLVTSLPGIAIVTGLALTTVRLPAVRVAATAALVAVLLTMQPAVTSTAGEDWPAVIAALDEHAQPGDALVMRPLLRAPFDYAAQEAGDLVALRPLSPTAPIGPPRRIYGEPEGSLRHLVLESDDEAIWVVARGRESLDEVEALRTDEEVARRREVVEVERARGDLVVYRVGLKAP